MGRPRSIDIKIILEEIQKYHLENPNYKIKIPELTEYLQKNGIKVEEYTIRRYKEARKLIDELNSKKNNPYDAEQLIVTHKPIDANLFLQKNNSRVKLMDALTERDNYYSHLADYSAELIKKSKKIETENTKLKKDIEELTREVNNLSSLKKEIINQQNIIKNLIRYIKDSVQPDIANVILDREGVFDLTSSIVECDKVINNIFKSEDSINVSESSEDNYEINPLEKASVDDDPDNPVNDLLKGFD